MQSIYEALETRNQMTDLQHPDTFLQVAGWVDLGNHLEANEELEKITASLRAHPDVLVVRWKQKLPQPKPFITIEIRFVHERQGRRATPFVSKRSVR